MLSNIWFSSDTHYSHKNICLGVSEWDDKELSCRKFATLEEMNELIISNINKYVKADDILYHLGDWSFGGVENIWNFRKQIKCKNIYLVPGNHDHYIKDNKILPNVFEEYNVNVGFVEELPIHDHASRVYAKELFSQILPQCYKLKINKTTLILSHFPLEEWEDMDRGSIHLHGHCHHTKDYTDLNLYYRRMDIGMDWEEFRPFNLNEILLLKNRPTKHRYD